MTYGLAGTGNLLGSSGFRPLGRDAGTPAPAGRMSAEDAIKRVSKAYNDLGRMLMHIEKRFGFVSLGNRVPCHIADEYNAAVRKYVIAAEDVFKQILAADPEYNIVQYTYDQNGQRVETKTGGVPLMPPTIDQGFCNPPPFLTADGELGFAFTAGVAITIIVVAAIAGGTVAVISVADHYIDANRPESALEGVQAHVERLQAKLGCIDQRIAQLMEAGYKPPFDVAAIDQFCETGVGPTPPPPTKRDEGVRDNAWVWWVGLGAAGLLATFVTFKVLTSER